MRHQNTQLTQAQLALDNAVSADKLSCCTEYVHNYLEWPLTERIRGKPMVQQLSVGGEFRGATENREQFVAHPIPPAFVPPKRQWSGSGATFEGATTQRTDFPAWDVTPRASKSKPQWVSTSGKFDGQTTNKADFRDTSAIAALSRFQRPQAQYVPNTAKFDGLSSHKEAYQSWPVTSKPVGKHYQPFVALKDDRDFKSTTAAAYIDHPFDGRAESKGPVFFLPPSDAKFEGETTSQDAYRQWTIKPRERRSKAAYVANKSPFPTETTYTVSFQPKAIQNGEGRPSKFGPAYLPVASCKFEGISTHKADYLPTTSDQLIKAVDFAPKSGFVYHKDDRDFITTSKKAHCVLKPV